LKVAALGAEQRVEEVVAQILVEQQHNGAAERGNLQKAVAAPCGPSGLVGFRFRISAA
jgi:hypothetical protein